MPRIATAASADEEASSSRVDDLIQRGRSQGHLSLSDLRTAFEQAGLTPGEARSILRELSEAGVRLADEETELKTAPRGKTKATSSAKATTAKAGATEAGAARAGAEPAARKTTLGRAGSPTTSTFKPDSRPQSATNAAASASPAPPFVSDGLTESIETNCAISSVSTEAIGAS